MPDQNDEKLEPKPVPENPQAPVRAAPAEVAPFIRLRMKLFDFPADGPRADSPAVAPTAVPQTATSY